MVRGISCGYPRAEVLRLLPGMTGTGGDNRKNNEAIEIYARKKGYGKKGEIIQEIPQPEKDQPQAKK